ncbi:hypothetical protein JCM11251_003520 [Rhodosporidiobolus azoricus]
MLASNTLAFTAALAAFFAPAALAKDTNVGVAYGQGPPEFQNNRLMVRSRKVKREDWANEEHCPGGSIGDADSCTFEPTKIYDTTLKRWTQYGSWYDNCNSVNTADIVATVTDSIATGNSLTSTTELSIGIASEGFSLGISQSFSESWSQTKTWSESQSITVKANQAGNINVANEFILAEGQLRIAYGDRKDGHYYWLQTGLEVYTPVPGTSDIYSANVADCGSIDQPVKGDYYYYNADKDAVKAGTAATYTYDY